MKDEKLTPRIRHTASALWLVYLGLTIGCALAYWLAGMSLFDAIAHSLTTVSTGGFSTYDASLGQFGNPAIEIIAIVFMLLGAISFGLHYIMLHTRSISGYWRDTQTRVFLLAVAGLVAMVTCTLLAAGYYDAPLTALRYAAFQVVSVVTSTGYGTADFSAWPLVLPVLVILSSFMGGCAGSTAGGMKVIRYVLLAKQGIREVRRLIHPSLVLPIKLGKRPVRQDIIDAVWGFFSVYVGVFLVLFFLVMMTGVDAITAFGAVTTSINNLGPGLGDVSSSFAELNGTAKWLCTLAMLLGRLEIFTVLVLFTATFWRG